MAKMTKPLVKDIQKLARSIIAGNPGGIRYSALVKDISQQHPELSKKAVEAAIWNLHELFSKEISKPERGLFKPIEASENQVVDIESSEQVFPTGNQNTGVRFL
jgi:hypothetical protein